MTASEPKRPPILEGTSHAPWETGPNDRWTNGDQDVNCADTRVAQADNVSGNAASNARLIASAPDLALLLAEAVEFYKYSDSDLGHDKGVMRGGKAVCGACDFIRRAERALGGGT